MKPIRWTKADEKRAAKMGWMLWETVYSGIIGCATNGRFKSDAEAARWVADESEWGTRFGELGKQTCRKAVLICCGGAR